MTTWASRPLETPAAEVPGAAQAERLARLLVGDGLTDARGMVLTGAPGAGKSTVLGALGRRLLAGGLDVRSVGTDDLGRDQPFATVTDLVGLPRDYPPRPDLADRVVEALDVACLSGPVVLGVDDAHRADAGTLDLLTHLLDRARALPVAVVLARRPSPERDALTAFAGRAEVVTAEVEGLDAAGHALLVRRRFDAAPGARLVALLDGTGGNPFRAHRLLDELERHDALTVGRGVVEVSGADPGTSGSLEAGVRAALRLVDPRARDLLRVLAVWGGPADLPVLGEVLGLAPVAVAEPVGLAVEAGVVGWTDDGHVAFVHDTYRDVLLADLDEPLRRALHGACAAVLRRAGGVAPAVARHAADAGRADAVAVLRAAATELRHAPAQAAELLAEAARRLPDESAEAAAVDVERVAALATSGQIDAVEEVARRRLALSRDPAVRATLLRVLVFCLVSSARVDAAIGQVDTALERVTAPEARAALTDVRRWAAVLGGRQRPDPPAEPSAGSSALVSDAIELYLLARPAEGYARARAAAALREDLDPAPWASGPSTPLWPVFLAAAAEGPHRARELSDAVRRAGNLWLSPYHHAMAAGILHATGAWDDALAEVGSCLDAARLTGTAWTSRPVATLARLRVDRGELDAAEAAIDAWRALEVPQQFGVPVVDLAEALLLDARGRTREAAALAGRAWRGALDGGRLVWPLLAGVDTLRLARAAGDEDLAARVARDTATVPLDQAVALAPVARLVLALDARDLAAARAAADELQSLGQVADEMTAREELACLAVVVGAVDEARAAGARATALASSVGAVTVERRLAARLRDGGVRLGARGRRSRPSTGWESLTPTERQIAELVGEGMTSPQVGARLFISPRTVQTHISHVLRKLGLRSRVELAAELSRRRA
ncbi:LuxR C-terminal-related transcriptional regulator [Actinomycetospora sp. TBRC 11914]|uniref:LuxR C-terminal-related transcriptional regulator n=1 Tax=Actinomycetospora sp. TBRC 11914 TaxID=2729387 RepID=UPI00145F9791|nr:LuxR C-terminal-related transcriptional regulator [Actinomycetospora sp. TBRC 11914]NMO92690.1 hypothetical protein [Actinomycetospora sp. TBRC 11914]